MLNKVKIKDSKLNNNLIKYTAIVVKRFKFNYQPLNPDHLPNDLF
jgi:hypothetical protein